MADEAFALSPINARPTLPTDADYDAIHEAFMETARGRWFLTEYAKRNRNADTRMVLDAVERIEATLASQKQTQTEAPPPAEPTPPVDLWPELSKAFTRARMEIAQRLVRESNAEAFEAIRASAETIKSVSWALRERGFDTRICDFLDVQVNAITDGYTGLMAESSVVGETEAEVLAAFDALIEHVEALTRNRDAESDALDVVVDAVADAMSEDDDDAPAMSIDDATTAFAPPQLDETPAEAVEAAPVEVAPVEAAPVEAPAIELADADAAFHAIYGDDCDIEIVDVAPAEEPAAPAPPTEPEINKQRLYEAKLAPYRSAAEAVQAPTQETGTEDDIEIAAGAEAARPPENPLAIHEPVPEAAEAAPAAPEETPQEKPASLGEALIASGVIQHPTAGRADPLAPFRRMSQAEKVALFT
jgi:hypothetical protein